jgi:hypothetical protein
VRLATLLQAAIVVLAVVHVGVLAYHAALTLTFPYDLNYGEGYVLNDALRLSRGEPIYVDLQQFPMVRSPYPPLFPMLWSGLVSIAGPALWPGRALSVAALAGILALLAWNARRARAGVWPMVVAPAVVLASPFVYQWAVYARVDMLALVFAAAAVCAAQWLAGWRGIVGAAILCSLALWTKQTTLTAGLAIAIAYLLRNRRDGLVFIALLLVPNGLAMVALNAATGGEFTRHVLEGNASNPVSPVRAAWYFGGLLALHLPLVVAGLWWVSRAARGVPSPIAVYVPVALFAAFSVGNSGSSVNYLLEPLVALSLALPFAWRAASALSSVAPPLFASLQLVLLLHWPNGFGVGYLGDAALGRTPSAGDAAVGAQVDAIVHAARGEVLSEPAGFALRNGRPVYVQPIDLRAEQLRGRWRSEPLVQALAAGRFELVITAYELFPSVAKRTIAQHFDLEAALPSPDGLTFRVYRYAQ